MGDKGRTDWKRLAGLTDDEIERAASEDSDTIVLRDDELADLKRNSAAGRPSYLIYRDKTGAYRWRLQHPSGRTIAEGSEGYRTRERAERAISDLRDAILRARLEAA
jgi:uncharacterized protein YegP (UPF0339 family)